MIEWFFIESTILVLRKIQEFRRTKFFIIIITPCFGFWELVVGSAYVATEGANVSLHYNYVYLKKKSQNHSALQMASLGERMINSIKSATQAVISFFATNVIRPIVGLVDLLTALYSQLQFPSLLEV